jgi:glycerol uptake facilitator-like aquaporin
LTGAGRARRLVAEALGTGVLVATVVGSGIMASKLTTDAGLMLLGNTIPTGAILVVLILMLGPVSGAHFNPAVSLVMATRGRLSWGDFPPYVLAQVAGGVLGTVTAHLMFDQPVLQVSGTVRSGAGQWIAEGVATGGLVLTIIGVLRFRADAIAMAVGLYITAAYWFTASTSFANPAVTIARSLTGSFAGIAPVDVPAFVAVQAVAAIGAAALADWLFADEAPAPGPEAAAQDDQGAFQSWGR